MPKAKKPKKKRLANGLTVTAFAIPHPDGYGPPRFVLGVLGIYYLDSLDYRKYCVGGYDAVEGMITPIPNPTPALMRSLKRKMREWGREDDKLEKRRARKDDSYRRGREGLVKEKLWDAFYANLREVEKDDQRLMTERQAAVAQIIERHDKKRRKTEPR